MFTIPPTTNSPASFDDIPQLSLRGVLGLWLAVVLPMAVLALGVTPWLIPRLPQVQPGLVFWAMIVCGMAWQTVVSLAVLHYEGTPLSWPVLKHRLWLTAPRHPDTGRPQRRMLWWIVPLGVVAVFATDAAFGGLDGIVAAHLPEAMKPSYGEITALATPDNKGAWGILVLAAISSVFNYALGEAFFFHAILLPRCQRVFGRGNWVANALLFGGYHLHKAAVWPTIILSCLAYSFPAQRTGSIWPAVLIHGTEGIVLLLAVGYVVIVGV